MGEKKPMGRAVLVRKYLQEGSALTLPVKEFHDVWVAMSDEEKQEAAQCASIALDIPVAG
jgi:hypothetical protein